MARLESERLLRAGADQLVAELSVQLAQATIEVELLPASDTLQPLLNPIGRFLDAGTEAELRLPFDRLSLEEAWSVAMGELLEASGSATADEARQLRELYGNPAAGDLPAETASADALPADDAPPDHRSFAPRGVELEPLPDSEGSLLSLDDRDLFGGGETKGTFTPPASGRNETAQGLGFDLFGSDLDETGVPPDEVASTNVPADEGPLGLPTDSLGSGSIFLTGGSYDVEITPETAALYLSPGGTTVEITGDGDDRVTLVGNWALLSGDAEGEFYGLQDALLEDQIFISIAGTEVVLLVA